MVTGAGGSIGSEICRQISKFQPRALVLVGRGENRIFQVEREMRDTPATLCAKAGYPTKTSSDWRISRVAHDSPPVS
jgi:NADP-dependent 3-hydroxy acid dehydrogenase YdfG